MLKLRLFKFLGIFIPYFKRKLMDAICNHLKNAVNNRIKEYDKKHLFAIKLITHNLTKYSIEYSIQYQTVNFSIGIEYVDNHIDFSFVNDSVLSITSLLEISYFVEFLRLMPQEELKRKFTFSLKN
jgi:hypothetical protein